MYFDDHPPPHFHVITRKNERVSVVIDTLAIQAGEADSRDTAEAFAWARERRWAALSLARVFRGRACEGDATDAESSEGETMSETKAVRVAHVKYASEYTLRLRWVNGKTMSVDLREPVHRLKGLRPLRDQGIFARATKGEGGHSVIWPGEIDMGADRLWEMTLEQNGHLDALEFIRWRWRHGLSLTDAAEALGLSRRQVAYYASGERPVPRTILLACKGWEAERQAAAA
jgi:Protein of unknown function (DUF2442)/Domain of unknown function (DUF4160)